MLMNFVLTQIFNLSFCFLFLPIHGRLHTSNSLSLSLISLPPSPAPTAAVSPSSNANSAIGTTVFNVRSFGAIGNGVTDDTQAFKMAWDSACLTEDSEILVPKGHLFMLQSTIFTGPCKSGLKMQVINVHACLETISNFFNLIFSLTKI